MKMLHEMWTRGQSIHRRIAERNERRRSIRELSSLSDRQLKDIGVMRGQIPEVVDTMLARKRALEAAEQAKARRLAGNQPARAGLAGDTVTSLPA